MESQNCSCPEGAWHLEGRKKLKDEYHDFKNMQAIWRFDTRRMTFLKTNASVLYLHINRDLNYSISNMSDLSPLG